MRVWRAESNTQSCTGIRGNSGLLANSKVLFTCWPETLWNPRVDTMLYAGSSYDAVRFCLTAATTALQ